MHVVPDLIGPGLRVLFCGINPGKLSGETGLHFARAGNRFWKLLCTGGFTERVLTPVEQPMLPGLGIGITNLVERSTTAATEIRPAELQKGAGLLEATVQRWQPGCVAVLGLGAYRTAFHRPKATVGPQPEMLAQRPLWLLPNPSGMQARYQMPEMTSFFQDLYHHTSGKG